MSSQSRRRARRARAQQATRAKSLPPESAAKRVRPYPPTLALTSGTIAMLAGIALITCPWADIHIMQALPARSHRLAVLIAAGLAILAGAVFSMRAMRATIERLGTSGMRPSCFAEWLTLAIIMLLLAGMAWHSIDQIQEGLRTGVIEIPSRGNTRYADRWLRPISFWSSAVFHAFAATVSTAGFGLMLRLALRPAASSPDIASHKPNDASQNNL